MKLNKEQDKIKDEAAEDNTVRMLADGTFYFIVDPKPLQAFAGLAEAIKTPLINLQGSIDNMHKAMSNVILPVTDFKNTMAQLVEPIRLADNFGKAVPQYFQTASVMQDLLKQTQESIKVFSDLVIVDFPLKNTLGAIDPSTVLDLDVKSAEIVDTLSGTVSFASVARQKADFGIWSFETEQSIALKVDRIETKVDSVQTLLVEEIYPFLIEDSKRKDDVLDQLLAYYSGKPQIFAKIKEVVFSDRTCKLNIDKIAIPLQQGKNEEALCRIIFKNRTTAYRLWNMDEIVEEMGESIEQTLHWKRRLYQTARQLNDKIALATGLKEFLIYTMSTICVNPTYLTSK